MYSNNSIVSLAEIGEDRNGLLCITDDSDCCTARYLPHRGEWYFPNGSLVGISGSDDSFYRNRGPSIVRLNRRNSDTSLSGIFQCEIPSSDERINIHIGIYHDGQGILFTLSSSSSLLILSL